MEDINVNMTPASERHAIKYGAGKCGNMLLMEVTASVHVEDHAFVVNYVLLSPEQMHGRDCTRSGSLLQIFL